MHASADGFAFPRRDYGHDGNPRVLRSSTSANSTRVTVDTYSPAPGLLPAPERGSTGDLAVPVEGTPIGGSAWP